MKKQKFHPEACIKNLEKIHSDPVFDAISAALEKSNDWFEDISFEDTVNELKEMASHFIPKKPNGSHYQSMTCPTCNSRIRSGAGSSSHVRDDRCRKCGQVIDWSNFPKY